MKIRTIGAPLCGGLMLLGVLTPVAAPAASTTTTCSPSKVKIVTSDLDGISTTSTTFGNIPEASVGFTQGAAGGCVIVRFSALTYATGTEIIVIRAFLGNAIPHSALPAELAYSADAARGGRSFEFVFPSVAPGIHTVHMQFRSALGDSVTVGRHNTVVQFAP